MKGAPSRAAAVDGPELLRRARAARERAYAPYSGFRVGAAVATEDGQVFEGANVENASYGLSVCAERVALQSLAAAGVRVPVVAVAVVADGADPCPPCGACRQVIFEFGPQATVYASGDAGRPMATTIRELLTHPFGPRRLSQLSSADPETEVPTPRWQSS